MRSQGRRRFVGLPMLTDWAIFFEHPRVPLVLIKPVLRIDLVSINIGLHLTKIEAAHLSFMTIYP